jgi:nucleoid-associated protein YgaU
MGLFDTIKNTFSKSEPATDVTIAPSQLLREAGLDPSGLKFTFGNAEITVKGNISSESDRQKILGVLSGIPGIDSVQDQLSVSAPPAAAEPPASKAQSPEAAEPAEPAAPEEGEARTYTVVSGDTLWKIAERMYGNGSQYMKIFEANTDLLENPDRIFPGQKLVIPEP